MPTTKKNNKKARLAAPDDGDGAGDGRLLTVALPAGRIRDEAIALFARAGIDLVAADRTHAGRRLVIPVAEAGLRGLIGRGPRGPGHREGGRAGLGVAR